MRKHKKNLSKKVFTYFIGVYFVLSGILISRNDILASNFGDICTSNANCTIPQNCLSVLGTTTKFCLEGGPQCIIGTATCGNGTCKPIPGVSGQGYCVTATSNFGAKGDACSPAAPCASNLTCKCVQTPPAASCSNICSDKSIAAISQDVDMTEVLAPKKKLIETIKFTPQVGIPGSFEKGTAYDAGKQQINSSTGKTEMATNLFSNYLGAFYRYGLSIVGLIATVTLMGGGILWLTSMGNDSKITKAKEMIFGSLTGVALLYGSYLILNTINPAMVQLKSINTQIIAPVELICCQFSDGAEMTTDEKCVSKKGKRKYGYSKEGDLCVKRGCCVYNSGTLKPYFCMENTEKNCRAYGGYTYGLGSWVSFTTNFFDGNCGARLSCENHIMNCDGKGEGQSCTSPEHEGIYGHCYRGTCYDYPVAELGMPCGTHNDGVCYKGSSCPDNLTHDFWHNRGVKLFSEGVSCGDNLSCCYSN